MNEDNFLVRRALELVIVLTDLSLTEAKILLLAAGLDPKVDINQLKAKYAPQLGESARVVAGIMFPSTANAKVGE